MLREIIDKNKPKETNTFLPKIPSQFNHSFMKALQNDAEIEGAYNKAAGIIHDQIQQNEAQHEQALDETWAKGILEGFGSGHKQGYDEGVKEGQDYGINRGLVVGLLKGWSEAETFKKPHRVYDLKNPSVDPMAKGATASELADNIPDTKEGENRLWRKKTDFMAKKAPGWMLSTWDEIKDVPFVYHQDRDRLGLNLNEFMKNPGQPVEGYIGKTSGNGQTTKRKVTKTKPDLVAEAIGKNLQRPTGPKTPAIPKNIPERPGRKPAEPPQVEPFEDEMEDNIAQEDDAEKALLLTPQKAIVTIPRKHKSRRGQTPDKKAEKKMNKKLPKFGVTPIQLQTS